MLILQRYLLRELIKAFLLSLAGVTAVMVVVMMGQMISRGTVAGEHVLKALPWFLPLVLAYTIPATMLFGATLVYGRFARDNEFDAVRMSGVHPLVVIAPSVLLATVLSCAVLYLAAEWVPRCFYRTRWLSMNVEVAQDAFFRALNRDRSWSDGVFTIFVESVEADTTYGVVIEKRNSETFEPELRVSAESATFQFDEEQEAVEVRARHAWVETFGGVGPTRARLHDTHLQRFPLPKAPPRRPFERPLGEVLSLLRQEDQRQARRALLSEVHLRLNLAVSCLSFVLVGVPLAIWFRRGHILAAFLVALGPMLLFHMATFVTKNLSQGGSWPVATPWAANLVLWAAGGILLRRLFRR